MFRIPVKLSTLDVIKANARLVSGARGLATPSEPRAPPPPRDAEAPSSRVGSKLLLALIGASAITGATLAYAKSNQDLRDLLKEYAPWTDDAIAMMYQERDFPGSWVLTQMKDLASSASDMVFGSSPAGEEKKASPAQPDKQKKTDILAPFDPPKAIKERAAAVVPAKPAVPASNVIEPKKAAVVSSVPVPSPVKPADKPVERKIPVTVESPEDSAAVAQAVGEAQAAYKRAITLLKDYSDNINRVMESCDEGGAGKALWEQLRRSTEAKEQAEARAEAAHRKLECMSGSAADQARAELAATRQAYERARTAASVANKYWPQVEEARRHFVDELEILFPRADIGAGQLDTRGGDTDALLLLALKRVLLYQQLLAKQDTCLRKIVDDAVRGDNEDLIRAKVDLELERERRELAVIYQKKVLAAQASAEKDKHDQLKRQLEVHMMHLQDSLDGHAAKVIAEERRVSEEKAAAERAAHGLRLAAVLGRLQGVDDALKARSDADKMARQSQVLWAASEALEGALRGRGPMQVRANLATELDAIAAAAAESDELVAAVLRGVPAAAREHGVLSEVALRDRFIKVFEVCRSVALVPECGARLPVFFLSWLQGALLARPSPPSLPELEDQPTDFSHMDTYDILERAKYWVDRGQWSQALRYMHLLRGAPSVVARSWAEEAALHLEARQAASALLAHASATGLLHL